jgi:hypothetical protein
VILGGHDGQQRRDDSEQRQAVLDLRDEGARGGRPGRRCGADRDSKLGTCAMSEYGSYVNPLRGPGGNNMNNKIAAIKEVNIARLSSFIKDISAQIISFKLGKERYNQLAKQYFNNIEELSLLINQKQLFAKAETDYLVAMLTASSSVIKNIFKLSKRQLIGTIAYIVEFGIPDQFSIAKMLERPKPLLIVSPIAAHNDEDKARFLELSEIFGPHARKWLPSQPFASLEKDRLIINPYKLSSPRAFSDCISGELNKFEQAFYDIIQYGTDISVGSAMEERLQIIEQLKEIGFTIIVPLYHLNTYQSAIETAKKPGSPDGVALQGAYPEFYQQAIARDINLFPMYTPQYILDGVYIDHARDLWAWYGDELVYTWENQEERIDYNRAGDAGEIIQLADNAYLSAEVLRGKPQLKKMQQQGATIFFLPSGQVIHEALTKVSGMSVYFIQEHIDVFISVLPKYRILIVDPVYYQQNKKLIDNIIKQTTYQLIVVDEAEAQFRPTNLLDFFELVIVNRDARLLISQLSSLGVPVLPTKTSLTANIGHGSPLRCWINELYSFGNNPLENFHIIKGFANP